MFIISMFLSSLKVKCPASGTKMLAQYVTMAMFYYIGTGTYWIIYITLLQVCIATFSIQVSK